MITDDGLVVIADLLQFFWCYSSKNKLNLKFKEDCFKFYKDGSIKTNISITKNNKCHNLCRCGKLNKNLYVNTNEIGINMYLNVLFHQFDKQQQNLTKTEIINMYKTIVQNCPGLKQKDF